MCCRRCWALAAGAGGREAGGAARRTYALPAAALHLRPQLRPLLSAAWAGDTGGAARPQLSTRFARARRSAAQAHDAQIARAVADAPWSPELLADIESITVDDFDLEAGGPHRHIDDSLDLVAIAVRA